MKVRLFISLILCVLSFVNLSANEAPILSNSAEISLLTCSPGAELYSLFGHSAMRVHDPEQGIDVVFNYGTFSFDEDFYFNFAMGRLNYKLSVSQMDRFVSAYAREGRGFIEQTLSLDSTQRQTVFEFLNWNYQPENRSYLYDFFYDNCSSILRDVLDDNLGEAIVWADLKEEDDPSFRNIIDRYLIYHPWGDFGIDLGLGLPCDKVPSSREYMFLPDKLMEAYDHAEINGMPLVEEERVLLEPAGLNLVHSLTDPVPLFWMFFGLIALITALGWRKRKRWIAIDCLLLFIYGAVGALIFFLWFITDHTATANNFNMLWAWPISILMIPLIFVQTIRRWFWMAYGAVLVIALLGFAFWPQMLHLATIPLMLTMLLRAGHNLRLDRNP